MFHLPVLRLPRQNVVPLNLHQLKTYKKIHQHNYTLKRVAHTPYVATQFYSVYLPFPDIFPIFTHLGNDPVPPSSVSIVPITKSVAAENICVIRAECRTYHIIVRIGSSLRRSQSKS